jgi:hypothetical protein
MPRLPLALLLSLSLLAGSGCTWSRTRVNDPDFRTKAASVVPGKTTARELIQTLGTPINWVELPGGNHMYAYSYGDSKTEGLTLLVVNILKTNVGLDSAFFLLDDKDVVREKYIGTNSEDLPWEWWAFGD